MKRSVELDEKKVIKALDLSNSKTLKEMLDKALDALIAEARRKSMVGILGTDFFEGDLNKMRKRNGRVD